MKKILPFLSLLCFFMACEKLPIDPTHPVDPPPTTAATLTSVGVWFSEDHHVHIDSFEYDGNNRLKNYYQVYIDSSANPVDTIIYKTAFSYNGNDSLPVSITSGNDYHILTYNSQRQIIKDSVTDLYTYYYHYGTDTFFTTMVLPPQIGTYQDTIIMNTGNIASRKYWFFMPNNIFHSNTSYTYSSLSNPLHNLGGLGLLIYTLTGKNLDYVSKNLFSSSTVDGAQSESVFWATSGQQVINGTDSFGPAYNLITFRYK